MAQYINKDTLVAEIEKLKDEAKIYPSDFYCGRLSICKELMNFLEAIEVKGMDLEKELGKYIDVNNIEYISQVKLFDFAKHFFELGLKQKENKL